MLRRWPRYRHDHRASLSTPDVRAGWVAQALAGADLDLVALDELQAALVQDAAESGEVEPDDARLVAAIDVLGAMVQLEVGDPHVAWARGQLTADLGRHGEAVHDLFLVAARAEEQAGDATGDRLDDLHLWADAARARAAMAFARGGMPLAAATTARDVRDAEARDDVAIVLEGWEATGDARVPLLTPIIEGTPVDLEHLRQLQSAAARLALDGSTPAHDAVLDVLATLSLLEPDEAAHAWNRGALLFELDRPVEAAREKLEAARRMAARGEPEGEIERARFHATLGFLLGDQVLSGAVAHRGLRDGDLRDEARKLLDDWLAA